MNDSTSFTMKDIARELGVSVATVSRALKDSPRISTEQKERIKKFAREHNFYPNLTAEQLRHNRVKPSNIIGVIIPQIAHYYFSTILSGIEEQARIRGYNIMVAQSEERYDLEKRICEHFMENRVCGVIVSQAKDTVEYDHFQKLANMGVPLVFYDRICTGINASRVVVDDYMGAFTAVTHLIETGCRRIAFYGASMKLEISKNRYNGYRDARTGPTLSLQSTTTPPSEYYIPLSEWGSKCQRMSASADSQTENAPWHATRCLPPSNSADTW